MYLKLVLDKMNGQDSYLHLRTKIGKEDGVDRDQPVRVRWDLRHVSISMALCFHTLLSIKPGSRQHSVPTDLQGNWTSPPLRLKTGALALGPRRSLRGCPYPVEARALSCPSNQPPPR